MAKDFSQYSPIDTVNDDEKLLGDAERFGAEPRTKSRIFRLLLSHGALICTTMLFFTLWMRTPSAHLREDVPVLFSPAYVTAEPVFVRFNGTLDFPSIYRGPPSPELDDAWTRMRTVGPTRMPREEMLKAGETDLRSKVRYPDKFGGGYKVSLDFNHQLHCLNLLRKATWLEYYESRDLRFQDTPEIVRMHLDHCIEMTRQNIMCDADVTMITWDWVQGHKIPYPNFNTRHKCRKILEWNVEHILHIDNSELTRFEDTVDIPEHHLMSDL